MSRCTRSTRPLSEELLRPEIPDPPTVSSEINHRKIAAETQYDKHTQAPLMPIPLGSRVYAKPRPSQLGSPWIYGQIIDVQPPAPTASTQAILCSPTTGPSCVQLLRQNTLPSNLYPFH